MSSERRWALAVRVLLLLSVVLAAVAVLESMSVRQARAELQQLRLERDEAKAAMMSTWARQSLDELGRAINGLDAVYASTVDGFGRTGGLCATGHLDTEPIVTFVLGTYLPMRAAGQSSVSAIDAMNAAVRASTAYRAVHPKLAPRMDR